MLDKARQLIPDLISFAPLYVYVQLHLYNRHSFYQQWHVSLIFLIIPIFFNLVKYDVNFLHGIPLIMSKFCICSFMLRIFWSFHDVFSNWFLSFKQGISYPCIGLNFEIFWH